SASAWSRERGVRVLRPFKLIALVCLLVALALDVVALLSPAWVTSERGSLSLWEACKRAPDVWHCLITLRTDWQVATLVLILTAATIILLSFLASLVSFCLGTPRQYYRVVAVLLLVAEVQPSGSRWEPWISWGLQPFWAATLH
uniref:Uncharacterized protein n=1 Tax=Terrapene triunguis TaxID=2587831 RepID=A0A674IBY4_9SAUR